MKLHIDVESAIERCLEVVHSEHDIVLDVIMIGA